MKTPLRLAVILLLGGSVAASAALFAPAAPWGGVDLGAVGASVFVLMLILSIWLFAVRGDAVFPCGHRERFPSTRPLCSHRDS